MTNWPLHHRQYGVDPAQELLLCAPVMARAAPLALFVGDADGVGEDGARLCRAMAGHGIASAAMRYRSTPADPLLPGSRSLAAAIGWLRSHAEEHGVDPARIVPIGHGMGALHVAGYVVDEPIHVAAGGGIAGAAMLSGIYDTRTCTEEGDMAALFGAAWRSDAAGACIAGLLGTELPLLFTVAERDSVDRQVQAAQLAGAWGLAHAAYPPMHLLAGHDHVSAMRSIGTADRRLELLLANFARRVAG
ncbi:hypothetical protein V5740_06155 [Croceibacterium sp. TMG7-5b_MA50]|uniref:hypothetical protein n=1 Tax=Croceibacterium sp. TMG7-5b_MA50 TaxID=3121290 RepID=UPI003221D4F0